MSGFDETPNNPTGYTSGPASSTPNDAFAGSASSSSYASSSADPYTANVPPAYGPAGSVPPPYTAPGYTPTAGLPNPGLATLLGFIPGVGAMYNGQFAKGIAHVVIFAVLVSLSDHVNGIFGLLVAGWVFYMVFDAYQTARARRDGLVAPDPFGLNNIGEKFGIGNGPNWSDFTARPAPGAVPPTQAPPTTGYTDYRDTTTTHAAAASGAPAYQGGVTPGVNDVPYQAVAGASGTAAAYAAPYSGYAPHPPATQPHRMPRLRRTLRHPHRMAPHTRRPSRRCRPFQLPGPRCPRVLSGLSASASSLCSAHSAIAFTGQTAILTAQSSPPSASSFWSPERFAHVASTRPARQPTPGTCFAPAALASSCLPSARPSRLTTRVRSPGTISGPTCSSCLEPSSL